MFRTWVLNFLILATLSLLALKCFQNNSPNLLSYRYNYYAIPIATSYLLGHKKDYTGYSSIRNFINSVTPPESLNSKIKEALSSTPTDPGCPYIGSDDIGIVDFTYLSFLFFGPYTESLLFFYLTLILISILCYLICFYREPVALGLLLIYLLALNATFYPLMGTGTSGLTDPRSFGILSTVPLIHLLYIIITKKKYTEKPLLILSIIQAVIFTFVYFCRNSVISQIILLLAVSMFFIGKIAIGYLRRNGISNLMQSPNIKGLLSRAWPMLLVLIGLSFLSVYRGVFANRHTFSLVHNLPQHPLWHNIRFGFSYSPTLASKTGWLYRTDQPDWASVNTAKQYLVDINDKIRLPKLGTSFPSTIDWDVYEQVGRELFFKTLFDHPLEVTKTFIYYKPKLLFENIKSTFWHNEYVKNPFAIILLTVLITLGFFSGKVLMRILLVSTGIFLSNLLIPIVFYPEPHVMGEVLLALAMLFYALTLATLYLVYGLLIKTFTFFHRKVLSA